ncbi:MAG TPA: DUF4232 domain-containing protein [Actinomycetes bacterium]
MRPARILAAVLFAAAVVAVAGCTARPTANRPAAAPGAPVTSSPLAPTPTSPAPKPPEPPPTTSRPTGPPATPRCAAAVLRGSNQGSEGAAGTIWYTVQLRNASARTCTVKGSPEVQLLDAIGAPVFASGPARSYGSVVPLRPGAAAQFALGVSNVCDSRVGGQRIRVTLPRDQGSLVVKLGFETCRGLQVQPLAPATA